MKRLLSICFALFICGITNFVFAASFNSRCIATSDNPDAGLVCAKFATTTRSIFGTYTHKAPTAPKDEEYVAVSDTKYDKSPGGGTAGEVKIYLYAKPKDGYVFDHWIINNNEKTNYSVSEQNYSFTWTHFNKDNNVGTTTVVAYFKPESAVTTATNIPVALVTLDNEKPKIGDEVTASFTMNRIAESGTPGNKNMMVEFVNWTDDNGTVLSEEETCTFKVDREMKIIANFRTLGEIPQKGKYYRVRNVYNRVMAISGAYKKNIGFGSTDIETSLLRWVLPDNHDYTEFWTGRNNNEWKLADDVEPLCVEAAPSTIFFVKDGKLSNGQLTQAELVGQNISTKDLTGNLLSTSEVDNLFYGYYGITSSAFSGAGLQWQVRGKEPTADYPYPGPIFNISTFKESLNNCAFAIQPIDEEHLDYFWFGANAEEEMFFENGYWTTMYAAFPYELYDEGVEAYYITTDMKTANGITYLCLNKIDDRIVPAGEAVLLKCTNHSDTKANRMLPLDPNDSKVKGKTLEGNILKGEYQLYKNANREGRINFDSSKMRVLGVNNDGIVGFYKLSEGTELKANKAYLDMSALPSEANTASFRLAPKDFTTGIEAIEEDGSSIHIEDNTVFDLMGNKVSHPQPGSIYIINGKKLIWR